MFLQLKSIRIVSKDCRNFKAFLVNKNRKLIAKIMIFSYEFSMNFQMLKKENIFSGMEKKAMKKKISGKMKILLSLL